MAKPCPQGFHQTQGCCKQKLPCTNLSEESKFFEHLSRESITTKAGIHVFFPGNNYSELVDVGSLGRLGCWVFGEIQYLHVLATSSIHPWKLIERFWAVCRVSRIKDVPELLDPNNKGYIPSQVFHRSETSWCFETRWIIRLFVLWWIRYIPKRLTLVMFIRPSRPVAGRLSKDGWRLFIVFCKSTCCFFTWILGNQWIEMG